MKRRDDAFLSRTRRDVRILVVGIIIGLIPSLYMEDPSSITTTSSGLLSSSRKTASTTQKESEHATTTKDFITSNNSKNDKEKNKKRTFSELLVESGSDKYGRHHYERYYEPWLQP